MLNVCLQCNVQSYAHCNSAAAMETDTLNVLFNTNYTVFVNGSCFNPLKQLTSTFTLLVSMHSPYPQNKVCYHLFNK